MDEGLLAAMDQWPVDIRELAMAADRALMRQVPGMSREIQPDGRLVGYMRGPGYRGTLFTLLLSKSGVKVGFSHGATLPDPAGLLPLAFALMPFAVIGYLAGSRLHARLSTRRAVQAVWALLIVGGTSLLLRAIAMP